MARFELDRRSAHAINRFNEVMQPVLDRLLERVGGRPIPEVRDAAARVTAR